MILPLGTCLKEHRAWLSACLARAGPKGFQIPGGVHTHPLWDFITALVTCCPALKPLHIWSVNETGMQIQVFWPKCIILFYMPHIWSKLCLLLSLWGMPSTHLQLPRPSKVQLRYHRFLEALTVLPPQIHSTPRTTPNLAFFHTSHT